MLQHPSLMVLLVMAVSGMCYGIARLYHYYTKLQRRGTLEAPVDMLEGFRKNSDEATTDEADMTPNRSRYSKAQARQRFKKGKT